MSKLVEFLIILTDSLESHEKKNTSDSIGSSQVSFYNENDIVAKRTVDMSTVVDFREGRTYLNEESMECVYIRHDPMYEMWSSVVLIKYDDFKKIFEAVNNVKVLCHADFKDIRV